MNGSKRIWTSLTTAARILLSHSNLLGNRWLIGFPKGLVF